MIFPAPPPPLLLYDWSLTLFILDSSISSKLLYVKVQQGSFLIDPVLLYRRKPKLNFIFYWIVLPVQNQTVLTNAIEVNHIIILSSTVFILIPSTALVAQFVFCATIFPIRLPTETLLPILQSKIRKCFVLYCTFFDTLFLSDRFH